MSDKHHRFKSWEHCYNFFDNNHKRMDDKNTFDHACLQLAFYLASWGMLRGGSFLLQKDYRVHEYFIKDVLKNPNYFKYFDRDLHMQMDRSTIQGLDTLIHETSNAYIKNIAQVNGEDKSLSITDTLASKILLGVYGNVPAYDRYFKEGLRLHGISQQFNEESLLELVDFYNQNEEEFQHCQRIYRNDGVYYTPMKLIDMYFWTVGYLVERANEGNKELNKITEFASQTSSGQNVPFERGGKVIQRKVQNPGLTDKIRRYIIESLNQAKADGLTSIDLRSGDIHKSLKLQNRMPAVTNAMVSLGVFRHEIIRDTPSGASSTKVVRYHL